MMLEKVLGSIRGIPIGSMNYEALFMNSLIHGRYFATLVYTAGFTLLHLRTPKDNTPITSFWFDVGSVGRKNKSLV